MIESDLCYLDVHAISDRTLANSHSSRHGKITLCGYSTHAEKYMLRFGRLFFNANAPKAQHKFTVENMPRSNGSVERMMTGTVRTLEAGVQEERRDFRERVDCTDGRTVGSGYCSTSAAHGHALSCFW